MRPATVEVRFQNLSAEADVLVGSSALPSVPQEVLRLAQVNSAAGTGSNLCMTLPLCLWHGVKSGLACLDDVKPHAALDPT